MKIQIEETIYEGTGAEIMDQLRHHMLDPADCPDTDSYIRFLQDNIIRTTGLDFPLPQGDAERQARAIFSQLAKVGALTLLEV